MNTYRIINITENLEKRHPRYSTTVELTYVDEMKNKKISLQPNMDVYLKIDKLPISFYQLKIEGIIQIIDVTGMRFKIWETEKKPRKVTKKKTDYKKTETQTKKQTTKKKTGQSKNKTELDITKTNLGEEKSDGLEKNE